MAIIPENQYPGKITPSSADYPYGEARNISAPGDGTGTPWEAALVNDIFGFQQALLSEASVTPSGDPETATTSQYLQALRLLSSYRYDADTSYDTGQYVITNTAIYLSLVDNNVGNDPDTDGGTNWEQLPTRADVVSLQTEDTRIDDKYERQGRVGITYDTPAAFVHRAGRLIYAKDSTGRARLITDLSPFLPAGWRVRSPSDLPPGLKAYYVSRAGNNTDGLTWATAYNSIQTAYNETDVDVIFVNGFDRFTIDQFFGTYTGSRDIAIISVGGRAAVSPQREVTWSAGTEPNTFVSSTLGGTPTQTIDTVNRDANGDFTSYPKLDTEVEVSNNPGSWTIIGTGSSQQAVVRRIDDATPTNETTWVTRSTVARFSGAAAKMYIYGIDWYAHSAGALSVRNSDIDSVIAVEDCGFFNVSIGDGFQVKDVGLSIAINCRASANQNDGFNYHELNGLTPHCIEIDCVGLANLETGTGNGSTCHEDVLIFRMNNDYWSNAGPGLADVQQSKSYNVSCTSNANTGSSNSYGALLTGTAEGWFDGFVGANNQADDIAVEGTATIHYRDCFPVPVDIDGTGTVNQDFS